MLWRSDESLKTKRTEQCTKLSLNVTISPDGPCSEVQQWFLKAQIDRWPSGFLCVRETYEASEA